MTLSHPTTSRASWARRHWRDLVAVAVLVVVVVAVQLWFLKPPWIYDPADYYASAQRWPDVFIHHRPLRVGLVLPVRVLQELFGLSEASWYGVPLAAVVGLAVSTYAVGRLLFTRLVGFAAGVLVVCNPYVLTWSSQIFPDVPSTALFTAGVAVVLLVAQRRGGGQPLEVADHVLLATAGALLGWSYLVREFIVVLFPVVAAILLLRRVRWQALATVAGSALAVFAAETAFNAWQYGDPLIRLREIIEKPEVPADAQRQLERIAERREARGGVLDRLLLLPRLLDRFATGPLLLALGATTVAGLWADARRRALPLVVWAAAIWGVLIGLSFIEVNAGQAILHPNMMRYWYPLFPPLLLAGLGGAWLLCRRVPVPRAIPSTIVALLAAAILLPGIRAIDNQPGTVAAGADHYRELRTHLATTAPDASTLWTDHRTGRVIDVFLTTPFGQQVWDGRVRWYSVNRDQRSEEQLAGSLVLLEDEFFEPRHSNARGSVPDWLMAIPDSWDVRWMSDNSEIALMDTARGDDRLVGRWTPGPDWGWTVLPRRGDSYAAAETLTGPDVVEIELGPGERVVVVDGAHPSMTTGEGGVEVSAGSYVAVDLEIAAEGAGNVVLRCMVFGADRRAEPNLVSLWGVPAPLRTAGGACRSPQDGRFRLGMTVNGPIRVTLGELTVTVDADGGG